jgi:hypothetical protein
LEEGVEEVEEEVVLDIRICFGWEEFMFFWSVEFLSGGFPLHPLCPSLGMHPTHGAGSMCGAFRIGGGSQHVGFPKSSQPLGGYQQQIPPIPPSPPLPPLGPFKQTDRQTESYSDSRPGPDLEGTTVEPSSLAPAFSFSYSYSFQLHQL